MSLSTNHHRIGKGGEDAWLIPVLLRPTWSHVLLASTLPGIERRTEMHGADLCRQLYPSLVSTLHDLFIGYSIDIMFICHESCKRTVILYVSTSEMLCRFCFVKGHQDELFVLEQHPVDSRIVLSAGHDGRIIIWDIIAGSVVKMFYNSVSWL